MTFGQNFILPSNPEAEDAKRPLVLVVDNNKQYLSVAFQAIQDLGYTPILAQDGEEGLRLARSYLPDIILTDTLLPGMNGAQMCKILKQNQETSHIKMVIVTGSQSVNKSDALSIFKVDAHLNKPLSFRELEQTLKNCMTDEPPTIEVVEDAQSRFQPKDKTVNFFRR